ncbi:Protein O-linked-mannose beta-1,4-N-acetylglucosaminyltransferase 2 [Nymphon striatum]|nr:Protein O-linked-mannose beta-1,4-N-acetylglucosaminyltransferase 2 [Nymphon striatum]
MKHVYLIVCVSISIAVASIVYGIFYVPADQYSHWNLDHGSSVNCIGTNNNNRKCYFRNICFHPNSSKYLFLHGTKTTIQGFHPNDRNNPALVDLSSVSDHNLQYFHYTDILAEAVNKDNLGKILFYEDPKLLFNRFNPDNLMHVFHDDLLPLYFTMLRECRGNVENCINKPGMIFNERRTPGEYHFLYQMITESQTFVQDLSHDYLHCFKSVIVGLDKHPTWYQYGFKTPQGPLNKNIKPTGYEIRLFTNFVQHKLEISLKKSSDFILIICRKSNRRILNVGELSESIKVILNKEVYIVSIEDLGVLEVLKLVCEASILISVHGSALILSLFLRPWSIIIEVFPYGIRAEHYTPYKTLANIKNMNLLYYSWENIHRNKTVTHPNWPKEFGGLQHLPNSVKDKIIDSFEVPLHLCCDNPEWLHRIYQDTFVDQISFIELLNKAWSNRLNHMSSYKNIDFTPRCGEVDQIYCNETIMGNGILICAWWGLPFNFRYLNTSSGVMFEIWIQVVGQTHTHAYFVKDTHYCFGPYNKEIQIFIWVRCILDNTSGPFSSKPMLCPI